MIQCTIRKWLQENWEGSENDHQTEEDQNAAERIHIKAEGVWALFFESFLPKNQFEKEFDLLISDSNGGSTCHDQYQSDCKFYSKHLAMLLYTILVSYLYGRFSKMLKCGGPLTAFD